MGFLPCKSGTGYRSLSNAKPSTGGLQGRVSGCPAGLLLMPAWIPHLFRTSGGRRHRELDVIYLCDPPPRPRCQHTHNSHPAHNVNMTFLILIIN